MRSFSISELENLTGIKAHTIRIWERRYAILKPERSTGNIRRYTADELARLLRLSLLSHHHRISQIAGFDDAQLQSAMSGLKEDRERWQIAMNALVDRMYRMDTEQFEAVLDECFLSWPVHTVVQEIIFPFLEKLGLLHHCNQRLEEHLAVAAIRRKLHWSIEKTGTEKNSNRTALLFLMGERHSDLLLLYLHYHLKKQGWQVIDLGLHASPKNLEDILAVKQPHCLFTYLTPRSRILFSPAMANRKTTAIQTNLIVAGIEKKNDAGLHFRNVRELTATDAVRLAYEESLR